MVEGTTLLFGNLFWASQLLIGYNEFTGLTGIAGLLANGVSINMAFSYWRKGCNLRNWKFVLLVVLAISPFVPIPLDFELVFFFSPFLSLVIAGVAALIKHLSPIDDHYDLWMYDHSGNLARASALAGVSLVALILSAYVLARFFVGHEYDTAGVALFATFLALPYALLVFRNVRAVSVWSASYMIQLFAMIAVPALSLLVLVLQME